MIKILDNGYIELLDFMGSDQMIIDTARVSTGAAVDNERNEGLMRFLIRNDHNTPLESCIFRFKVKAPIFVARQWVKHRISSWNEKSMRYTDAKDIDMYLPNWKEEGLKGHPEFMVDTLKYLSLTDNIKNTYKTVQMHYSDMVSRGVCKEQARSIIPVGAFTEWIWTVNLSSLYNFLKLRTSEHAQEEIRVYANAIIDLITQTGKFPKALDTITGMITFDSEVKRLLNLVKDPRIGAKELATLVAVLESTS